MAESEKKDKSVSLGELWRKRIRRAGKSYKTWRKQAHEAYEAYNLEIKDQRFPLFWSNTEIQHAACFASAPKAEVRRRHVQAQGPEKDVAQVLERAIDYQFDVQDLESPFHQAVNDYLVAACGGVRIHYNPEIEYGEEGDPLAIINQGLTLEHIPYNRLTWEPNKTWEAIDWLAIEHLMDKDEFKAQFPGQDLPESAVEGEGTVDDEENPEAAKYSPLYRLWEVWDKPNRRVLVVADGRDDPVEVRQDTLGLSNFYPMARPMLANIKKDELIPKPDFCYIRSQLMYVNRLTKRIDALTDSIRDRGFYDENFTELASLENAPDGTMVPLRNLAERLAHMGGTSADALIAKLPIDEQASVLSVLKDMREDAKEQVYEITGISDIVRGVSAPSETATAQEIKGRWAGVRFGRKEQEVVRFCRDTVRIMGEIIGEHFDPMVLSRITGIQVTPPMVALMRDDASRNFAIDIETDSTIAADEQAEKETRIEMLTSVTDYLGTAMEVIQNYPAAAPLMQTMLLFMVRSFKHGRQLEEEIQALGQNMQPVQDMQQQLQDLQAQLEEAQGQAQDAQNQLAQVDQQENARKDMEAQANAQESQADVQESMASTNLKQAQAAKTWREAQQPILVA